jgi:acetoin utilization deacetylase AcuC-like enzyme
VAPAQLVGQGAQAFLATGDQRDVVAPARQLAGELGADAGGGAGDQDGRGGGGGGEAHGRHDGGRMLVWTHHRWRFPLPEGHRFPLDKYARLADRVVADGICAPEEVLEPEPVPWALIERVHAPELVARIRAGELSVREQRGLGLPWSPELVERGRRAIGGSLGAAELSMQAGVGMNLGGGTHHAGRAFARGFCLFNDVVVALAELRARGLVRRAIVVDCDVHQGDGTADLLGPDPDAFTLSLHGARNYPFQRIPSDLDVDLPNGTGDDAYLEALDGALSSALEHRPDADIVFYLAGADPWEGDRLGRLALTKPGLLARDELVLERIVGRAGIPACVVLAGGYAEDVRDTVDINAATAAAVARRVPHPGGSRAASSPPRYPPD